LRQVSLLSGEGAIGKTLISLQRAVAHPAGRFWLGMELAQGPAMYVGAEDEADEIQRRTIDITAHYGVKFSELAGHLHLLSLAGEDAVLGAPDKSGLIKADISIQQAKGSCL
jgi:RecA-family ATPase